jgi:hypothetical protein
MYPHRIRLRDPWQHEASADAPGHARSRRRFGYPGRIDPHERVWLTVAGVAGPAEVSLNGVALGRAEGDAEFEVTGLLRPRNEVMLEGPGDSGGVPFAEVALEVRATAFLRRLAVECSGEEVVATGEVAGHADGALDLYLVLGRSPAAYATVTAAETGKPFRLSGKAENPEDESPRVAKIELVQGAVTWFTVEVNLREEAAQGPCA